MARCIDDEGSAQTAGVLIAMHTFGGVPKPGELGDRLMYLASVDSARFNRLVVYNETIRYTRLPLIKIRARVEDFESG